MPVSLLSLRLPPGCCVLCRSLSRATPIVRLVTARSLRCAPCYELTLRRPFLRSSVQFIADVAAKKHTQEGWPTTAYGVRFVPRSLPFGSACLLLSHARRIVSACMNAICHILPHLASMLCSRARVQQSRTDHPGAHSRARQQSGGPAHQLHVRLVLVSVLPAGTVVFAIAVAAIVTSCSMSADLNPLALCFRAGALATSRRTCRRRRAAKRPQR
jgi:hypothetical protein